jgi:hypothetical protein
MRNSSASRRRSRRITSVSFVCPTTWTKNPDNTYDGAHFDVHWYDHVVDSINGGSNEFALRVHELSLGQYLGLFLATADDFIAESDIRLD